MDQFYSYVGPEKIREQAKFQTAGTTINCADDVEKWLDKTVPGRSRSKPIPCTFTLSQENELRLAIRESEHVACAGGRPVLAAGELEIDASNSVLIISMISNQSTGYCPEPDCLEHVFTVLNNIGISYENAEIVRFEFRRCERCDSINLIKDDWWGCACGAELPKTPNLHP